MNTAAPDVVSTFKSEARNVLRRNHEKILHCLRQLSEEDVNYRPFEAANSIANIISHLRGNLTQWIVSAFAGRFDVRNRPAEFARDLRATPQQLFDQLTATYEAADQAIAAVTLDSILAPHKIQGYNETTLSAVFHAVSHFEGHTHQIVYITRLRLGDRYAFKWVPTTPEQISANT